MKAIPRKIRIGVIGASKADAKHVELARQVGAEIARRAAVLVCGGLGGIMEAACRGAKEAGGFTVGILPGRKAEQANPYVDLPIVTDIGYARNAVVVLTSQAVIAVSGRYGTLSEIAYALNYGIPVIGLSTWDIKSMDKTARLTMAKTPAEAVSLAFKSLGQ